MHYIVKDYKYAFGCKNQLPYISYIDIRYIDMYVCIDIATYTGTPLSIV